MRRAHISIARGRAVCGDLKKTYSTTARFLTPSNDSIKNAASRKAEIITNLPIPFTTVGVHFVFTECILCILQDTFMQDMVIAFENIRIFWFMLHFCLSSIIELSTSFFFRKIVYAIRILASLFAYLCNTFKSLPSAAYFLVFQQTLWIPFSEHLLRVLCQSGFRPSITSRSEDIHIIRELLIDCERNLWEFVIVKESVRNIRRYTKRVLCLLQSDQTEIHPFYYGPEVF